MGGRKIGLNFLVAQSDFHLSYVGNLNFFFSSLERFRLFEKEDYKSFLFRIKKS